jgi:hypothetical protein
MQIPLVNPVWQFLFVSNIHKSHNAVYSGKGHADVPYTQDILLAVSTIHPPIISGNMLVPHPSYADAPGTSLTLNM